MALEEIRDTFLLMQSKVQQVEEYHLLQERRYSNPNGYLSYESAAKRSCAFLLSYQLCCSVATPDATSRLSSYLFSSAARSHAPAYWLGRDLQTAILQSDIPEFVVGMKRVIPCGMLFLPDEGGLVSPDGEKLQVVFFSHLLKGETVTLSAAGQDIVETIQYDCIQWATLMSSGVAYAGNLGVDSNVGLDKGTHDYTGMLRTTVDSSQEDKFIDAVGSLVLQVLLLLQTRPDLVEEETQLGFGGNRLKAGKKNGNRSLLRPRWIGKSYRIQQTREKVLAGNHAPLRTHWRRGHHKRVPVGERSKNQRKWVWIEPTLVNAP